jgi:dTDP-glucose pyrophosphorylase
MAPAATHAIVMAAGEGTRLRPITARWPKPILPVDGKPVIALLLRELRAAGIERATIVTGHLAEQVESLVGDGAGFGLELTYVRQPRPDGSADAVRRALDAGASPPAVVAAADTVFAPGSIRQLVTEWSGAGGAIAARRGQPASGAKAGIRGDECGWVVRVVDDAPESELTSAPLWGLGADLLPFLDELRGPPYELAAAYQAAVDAGTQVRLVVIAGTRDLTDPVDLIRENFPYLT